MRIKALHPSFRMPERGSAGAAGYDLFMPNYGHIDGSIQQPVMVPLGFCAEVPEGFVAMLLPRSGVGAKHGLALNNTVGVIDSDYRGEWKAALRLNSKEMFSWEPGDRILQMIIVPVITPTLHRVEELTDTVRGHGGFGSTGTGGA